MSWQLHDANTLLDGFAQDWQQLNAECNDANPVLDLKFVGALYRHFSDGETVVLAVERGERGIEAMALLQPDSFGRWKLFMPSQGAVGPIIMRPRSNGELLASLRGLCRALPGYAWQLGFQKQDPKYSALAGFESRNQVEAVGHAPTTFIDVRGSFDEYWTARPKQVRQRINRTLRWLEEENLEARLSEITDRSAFAEAIDQYADIESRGWKGKHGTAIRRGNRQGSFYREMLQAFAGVGGARIYQLFFSGKMVASLLTVVQGGMLVVLKTTFDEEYARFSPGRLMDYLMLQTLFADAEVAVVENYTNASEADQKWTTGSRDICHLNYFRHLLYCRAFEICRKLTRRNAASGNQGGDN